MREELVHQVALSMIPGIGRVALRQLVSYCGSARAVFEANFHRLRNIPGIGPKTARCILASNTLKQARQEILKAGRQGVRMIFYTDVNFPKRLKALEDAPLLLYTKGRVPLNHGRTLGIVGTRQSTAYGQKTIRNLMSALQPYQPLVVSGLAYGIDITAHREALAFGLPTIAILGNSLDRIYPSYHRGTAHRMMESGGLVSELAFGSKPEAYHFPGRNRIIAGLSDALLIVEAGMKGGALITGRIMETYNRPVFAVPGPLDQATSAGCHHLIKSGAARIFTEPHDLVRLMGWDKEQRTSTAMQTTIPRKDVRENAIIEVLKNQPYGMHIDDLCWQTSIPVNAMGGLLLNLEFEGIVKSIPGKKFLLLNK